MPTSSSSPTELPRRLGLWSAIAVVVGSAIGSGIFRSPAGIADRIPGPAPLLTLWVVGGLISLCGALTLAEVASEVPRTGGIYAFLKEGWGRLPAFLFGWAQLTVVRAAALGAISITFAEYFLRFLGYDPTVAPYSDYSHYIAAVAIAITATFNVVGVKMGSAVVNVTTIMKTGGLGVIILLALTLGLGKTGGNFTPWMPQEVVPVTAYGAALVSLLWAYDGWMDLSYVA
ncbi:MAG: amino acid permease, partial [Gemmatimonadetes bacterium]|nr:amino acid permease [Gemmatimonadota bacterium]